MINVSIEFQKLMNERTDFKENAEITFVNGTVLNLTEKDFTISNNNVTDASETNGIPLGVAVCRSIQIELMNDDDRFSKYDFFGARIRLYLTFQLSETVERIEYGTFTVLTPETYGTTVIITALDDMHKTDREYTTSLTFPTTIGAMYRDVCTSLGISQGTTTFLHDNFVVNEKPTDITFRQLLGYIAMLAGGNARVDRTGRLQIVTYDFENMESIYNSVLNGGSYNPWDNPVNIDGGSFLPWNDGDSVDGRVFGDRNHFHMLCNWSNLKVDTDDVVITGIQTTYTNSENIEQMEMYGTEGYVLSIENPLIAGQEEFAVGLIGNVMVGGRFRQFSGDLVSNPTIEFMDIALILDRKGNMYASFVTDINFQFFGFTSVKNSAAPALRNSAKTYSEATKSLVKARKLISEERTAREQAVAQLANDLKNSSGLFMTEDVQLDGSTIYYMHDKPTLEESMIVWKLTALAFGISTDGGKTYPYGFTVNGELITKLLYAEGINADYITSGSIDSLKIAVKNLVVGENVSMGPNATISWNKVTNQPTIPTDTNQLTNGADYQTASQVTQITKDTVTTSFVNALGVTAKSVAAENITGTTISGKKYVSNYSGSGSTLGHRTEIDSSKITSHYSNGTGTINGALIKLENAAKYTEISDAYIELVTNFSNNYSKISGNTITSYGGTSNIGVLSGANLTFTGNGTISNVSTSIELQSTNMLLKGSYIYIAENNTRLGFFGKSISSTKKTVSKITSTSSATTSTVASKINDLIDALQAYNLIG